MPRIDTSDRAASDLRAAMSRCSMTNCVKGAAALIDQLLHVTDTHPVPRRDRMHGEIPPAEIGDNVVFDRLQPGSGKAAHPCLFGRAARRTKRQSQKIADVARKGGCELRRGDDIVVAGEIEIFHEHLQRRS